MLCQEIVLCLRQATVLWAKKIGRCLCNMPSMGGRWFSVNSFLIFDSGETTFEKDEWRPSSLEWPRWCEKISLRFDPSFFFKLETFLLILFKILISSACDQYLVQVFSTSMTPSTSNSLMLDLQKLIYLISMPLIFFSAENEITKALPHNRQRRSYFTVRNLCFHHFKKKSLFFFMSS